MHKIIKYCTTLQIKHKSFLSLLPGFVGGCLSVYSMKRELGVTPKQSRCCELILKDLPITCATANIHMAGRRQIRSKSEDLQNLSLLMPSRKGHEMYIVL